MKKKQNAGIPGQAARALLDGVLAAGANSGVTPSECEVRDALVLWFYVERALPRPGSKWESLQRWGVSPALWAEGPAGHPGTEKAARGLSLGGEA